MTLKLHDTLARKKRDFEPADPERVTLYVCGPTVYNNAHIGNARPPVVFDTLFRLLRRIYGADHVVYARNITDVDDKIIAASEKTGKSCAEIAEIYTDIYRRDMRALNVIDPTMEPTATGHMPEMIGMIRKLKKSGFAYESKKHVLFDINKYEAYGKLSRRDRDAMVAGARVEVAPYKRDPADFVLWKPAKEGEPSWSSQWGDGRPGWHLECSAMIEANLGETIDIHGGGADLVFPHHENELAQSACAHGGSPLARYWMHNGFLNIESEKMSKSLGNVMLVSDLLNEWPGEVMRWALLSAHYRQPLDWTRDLLEQSRSSVDRAYQALRKLEGVEPEAGVTAEGVTQALEDDLNTPKAFAEVARLINAANKARTDADKAEAKARLIDAGDQLGILQSAPEDWFKGADDTGEGLSAEEIEAQIEARKQARANRDFAEADRIRDALADQGVVLEDGADGTIWRREA